MERVGKGKCGARVEGADVDDDLAVGDLVFFDEAFDLERVERGSIGREARGDGKVGDEHGDCLCGIVSQVGDDGEIITQGQVVLGVVEGDFEVAVWRGRGIAGNVVPEGDLVGGVRGGKGCHS